MDNTENNTDQPLDWSELEPLIEQALELEPTDRAGFLRTQLSADAAERVAAALNSEDTADVYELREPIARVARSFTNGAAESDEVPEVVGPYLILGRLGRGGMGEVFVAQRADGSLDRKVALKLIRRDRLLPGAEVRFQREREILSALQHENIAQIIDAGVSEDGSSYFVMELVDGAPIDAYCDQAELPLRERLQLMESVANAVDFAHQNLVLHRDLKPSNIVVTERSVTTQESQIRTKSREASTQATVKLLDFGVAKLLEADPAKGDDLESQYVLLTPRYASPEQRRGDRLTTASDVYSLGMVLRALIETESEPDTHPDRSAPSSNGPTALPTDLRAILNKALEQDREIRYQSAAEFAADLRRFRLGRAISIRRPTLLYLAQTMVRRQPIASGAIAIALVGLLVAGGLILNQWRIAETERTLANARTREASEVNDLLFAIYEDLESTHHDHEATHSQMRQVLERTQARLDVQLASAPDLRAGLDLSLAHLYMQNGDREVARALLEKTVAALPKESDPILRANALYRLGEIASSQRDWELASDYLAEALKLQVARFGEHDRLALRTQILLGQSEERLGQHRASVVRLENAVATARALYPEPHPDLQWALRRLGRSRFVEGDLQGALEANRGSLEVARKLYGKHSRRERAILSQLTAILKSEGDFDQARRYAAEYLESCLSIGNDRCVGNAHVFRAEVEREAGALLEAERIYRRVISDFDAAISWSRQARARNGLGMTLLFQNRSEEAEEWLLAAVSRFEGSNFRDTTAIAKAYLALAQAFSGDERQLALARERQAELQALSGSGQDFHKRQTLRLLREAEARVRSGLN